MWLVGVASRVLADAARHSKFTDKLRAHLESLPTEHADTETLKGALVALLPQVRKRSQRRRLRPPPLLTVRPHRWMGGLTCVVVDHSLNVIILGSTACRSVPTRTCLL